MTSPHPCLSQKQPATITIRPPASTCYLMCWQQGPACAGPADQGRCAKADICQLGMDQRKVNMLAREYCDDIKRKLKPVILSHAMLPGLKQVGLRT